jgi:hypothetical protein
MNDVMELEICHAGLAARASIEQAVSYSFMHLYHNKSIMHEVQRHLYTPLALLSY